MELQKIAVAKSFMLLMKHSLDESKIADIHKMAYLSPIYKDGSKLIPEQNTPVSLTSHVIMVSERVINGQILKH